MSNTIECYTGFYQEKGEPAVCGIVLSRGGVKKAYFKHRPNGDYLNGLLELLMECIEQLVPLIKDSVLPPLDRLIERRRNHGFPSKDWDPGCPKSTSYDSRQPAKRITLSTSSLPIVGKV